MSFIPSVQEAKHTKYPTAVLPEEFNKTSFSMSVVHSHLENSHRESQTCIALYTKRSITNSHQYRRTKSTGHELNTITSQF